MKRSNPNYPIISLRGLTKYFGNECALSGVDLDILPGGVIGLVGENGAGKTTLLRHVLGLFKPKMGSVSVFGCNPVHNPEYVLANIGYVSEDRELPDWMQIAELIRYSRAFYPDWDDQLTNELMRTFELNPASRIKGLSRGQRARVSLLIALGHRPQLLILDEPSSGLDPIVRRDVLAAVIRTVADEGRTVIFSSHLLDEVQRVADHLILIHDGRIQLDLPLEVVFEDHHRLIVRFADLSKSPEKFPGVLSCEESGEEWKVISNGRHEQLKKTLADQGAEILEDCQPTLEEIFVARCDKNPQQPIPAEKKR